VEPMELSGVRASRAARMPEMSRREKFFANRLSGWSHRSLLRWLRKNLVLGPAAVCLELGCGNGEVAAGIVEAFSPERYIATDYDREQIEMAGQTLARRFPSGIPSGLELRTADALHLEFSGESFDAVFAFAMLHHVGPTHEDVKGMMDALTECHRVLRPGGHFVYRDFMNTTKIRAWLASRGYQIEAARRRLRWDQVIARKPARPGASA
jgi:ubiquinone/menaquinone biosynthesis C-methylase UbiE